MKKSWVIVGIIVLAIVWIISVANTIAVLDEKVEAQWSEVANQYQRRSELVPNLVSTVQGAANFEKNTIQDVIEARKQVTELNVDQSLLTNPAALQQFEQAQSALSSSLSRLLVTVERYPQLKATENFGTLQSQLEGTENRIAVARRDYIESVRQFNTKIRTFPGVLINNIIYGYEQKPNLSITPEQEAVPDVKFN